nr:unnamed protein product [Callosobruchus chinensis]
MKLMSNAIIFEFALVSEKSTFQV